jgi:hypothetical protein
LLLPRDSCYIIYELDAATTDRFTRTSTAIDYFRRLGLLISGVYIGDCEDVSLLGDGITAEFNLISGCSQNCEKRLLASSCVSVRPSTWNNSAPTGRIFMKFNPLKPESNPICYLLALLAHHFLHVSRIRVKSLTLR